MLQTVKIGSNDITRLIVGGNPFSGNSHVNDRLDWEMRRFYTSSKILEVLRHCEDCGINSMLLRGDMHIMRLIMEYRANGGTMNWIGMTGSEFLSYEGNVRQMVNYGAQAIYHHGSVTDELFKKGEFDELKRRVAFIKEMGLPAGLGTHMPEVIDYAEEHDWGVDFYMACIYNISRTDRVSSAITGIANGTEIFDETDIPIMYKKIRETSKPCIAFKILGATRRCQSQDTVKHAIFEAYRNIKPCDMICIGVYPKDVDQVALDTQYAEEAMKQL